MDKYLDINYWLYEDNSDDYEAFDVLEVSRFLEMSQPLPEKIPCCTSILCSRMWLTELLEGHTTRIREYLGMQK